MVLKPFECGQKPSLMIRTDQLYWVITNLDQHAIVKMRKLDPVSSVSGPLFAKFTEVGLECR